MESATSEARLSYETLLLQVPDFWKEPPPYREDTQATLYRGPGGEAQRPRVASPDPPGMPRGQSCQPRSSLRMTTAPANVLATAAGRP